MSPVFLITLLLVAAIAYTIYRKERRYGATPERELYAANPRSLFADGGVGENDRTRQRALAETSQAEVRSALVDRASRGDLCALDEASRLGGAVFYGEVIASLLRWSDSSTENLQALAAHVTSAETLRGSVELSRAYSRLWEVSPDSVSTARALHLAALSDDAAEFARLIEVALRLRREGRMLTAGDGELLALFNSEFWVLSSAARASGAAFVLKQQLAALRAELSLRDKAADA